MFIDYAKIRVQSGKGGNGCVSFRREKFVPKGGPDGGDGGRGGNILVKGNENINTLIAFRYTKLFKAKNGHPGEGSNRTGADGEDVVIDIPLGTEIYQIYGTEHHKICEIVFHGQEYILAKGGNGGRGNVRFKTPTNQSPRYAKEGGDGEYKEFELVLKLMADVGLVGFPNAGKSTLLSKVSAATPKIADYEFTTLEPALGVVKVDDFKSFVMADIPGIIEGAHSGKGLGIQFLRHIQRTRILLFLIEVDSQNPLKDFQILKKELYMYDPKLDRKIHIVVLSKIDTIPLGKREKLLDNIKNEFTEKTNEEILTISAVTGENINKLIYDLYEKISQSKQK